MDNNLFQNFQKEFEVRLKHTLASKINNLKIESKDLDFFLKILNDFILEGGKRIRPNLIFLGWYIRNNNPINKIPKSIFDVAISYEILHSAALIHDDIIDNSSKRRNKPTVHEIFKETYTKNNNFHISASILLGDIALTWADDVFHSINFELNAFKEQRIWEKTKSYINYGQFFDLLGSIKEITFNEIEQINTLKTALYTIEYPLLIGSYFFENNESIISNIKIIGNDIGMLFQEFDDFKGIFGNSKITGKPVGDDIKNSKKTTLIYKSLEIIKNKSNNDYLQIRQLLGKSYITGKDVQQVMNILNKYKIKNLLSLELENKLNNNLSKIQKLEINESAKIIFSNYIKEIMSLD